MMQGLKAFQAKHPRAHAAMYGPTFGLINFLLQYFFGDPVDVGFLVALNVGAAIFFGALAAWLVPKYGRKRKPGVF